MAEGPQFRVARILSLLSMLCDNLLQQAFSQDEVQTLCRKWRESDVSGGGLVQVVDISVGQSVPEVSNFRSLPSPDSAIWPQFLVDVSYHGKCIADLLALVPRPTFEGFFSVG